MTAILGSAECFFYQGFCLPKEIIEDGGQGGTEFHDYEDGGIGDGEGKKDVSDKIENEDQVRFEVYLQYTKQMSARVLVCMRNMKNAYSFWW